MLMIKMEKQYREQQQASRCDEPFQRHSQRRMLDCNHSEPFGNAEESAQPRSLQNEPSHFGFSTPIGGIDVNNGSVEETRFEQIFREECELRERELLLAQEKVRMARNIRQRLSMLYDQDADTQSQSSSSVHESSLQRTTWQKAPDYVADQPVEAVDGMNRISVRVARGINTPPRGASHNFSAWPRGHNEPLLQRAMPPVMRVQPLQSPQPLSSSSRHVPYDLRQLQQQVPVPWMVPSRFNAGVQTEPTTEDPTGGRPLTIERDDTLTRQAQTTRGVELSTSSLSLADAGGAISDTVTRSVSSCSCHRVSSAPRLKTKGKENKNEGGAKPTQLEFTSNGAGGTEAIEAENGESMSKERDVDDVKKENLQDSTCLLHLRQHHSCGAKGADISSPNPVRANTMLLSPSPDIRNMADVATAAVAAFPDSAGGAPQRGNEQVQQPLLPAAWYLPTSRVLGNSEFKKFLRGESISMPMSTRPADPPPEMLVEIPLETPVHWSPAATSAVAPMSSCESRELAPTRAEGHILEFPPVPDDSSPSNSNEKCVCVCGGSRRRRRRPLLRFTRRFPFIKNRCGRTNVVRSASVIDGGI